MWLELWVFGWLYMVEDAGLNGPVAFIFWIWFDFDDFDDFLWLLVGPFLLGESSLNELIDTNGRLSIWLADMF